jgi:hypothetical protein
MKQILPFFITFFFTLSAFPLHGIPVEMGIQARGDMRFRDSFDTGIENFRSSVIGYQPNVVQVKGIHQDFTGEVWIRFREVAGPNHSFGIALGKYFLPAVEIREFRPDPSIYYTRWTYTASYLMFTYHYIMDYGEWRFFRKWRPELGIGFGLIPGPDWKGAGFRISGGEYTSVESYQHANFGSITRMETAFTRPLSRHLFFRAGIGLNYVHISGYSGTVHGLRGGYYVIDNQGYAPITENTALFIPPDSVLGEDFDRYVPTITGRAKLTLGTAGIFISIGARF